MDEQLTLTTGQAAKIFRVSQRTVIRWIDSGRLTGHRFPGEGGHRRILKADIVSFLKENKLPIPEDLENSSVKVLIVEDEAIVALLIEETLQEAGYETRVATNGFEAGQAIESFAPDVITLDLKIPGIPGVELLVNLRNNESDKHLGIVVVSGMPNEALQEALAKGADYVIAKPFRNKHLLDCISQLGDAPASNRSRP